MDNELTSNKPYIIRAMHEWMCDNNLTPYVVVDTTFPEVTVPLDAIENDQIVLNISYGATKNLHMSNDYFMFSTRFSGHPFEVVIPVNAIKVVFPKEQPDHQVIFELNHTENVNPPPQRTEAPTEDSKPPEKKKPTLTVVK